MLSHQTTIDSLLKFLITLEEILEKMKQLRVTEKPEKYLRGNMLPHIPQRKMVDVLSVEMKSIKRKFSFASNSRN